MKKIISVLLVLSLLLPLSALGEEESFEEYAEHQFSVRNIIGGAVILSRNGETLASYAYGRRARSKQSEPVTPDTCFRIASVTKLVSAVGLIRLMEEKGLSYDTPISDLLGFPVYNPNYPDIPITVRQILTHTTGFAATSDRYRTDFSKLRKDTTIFVKNAYPGKKYVYSNRNGGMIGALIEAMSGQSVNTYMNECVFGPLGINAAYNPALLKDQSDISDRLAKDRSTVQTVEKALQTIKDYNDVCDPFQNRDITVGSLYISANGLDRILKMLVQGGSLDGVQILPPGTVDKMMECQVFEGSSVLADKEYTLGLARVTGMPGGTWYGHQGRLDGLSSNAYFQPDTGLCVTVIANGYSPAVKNGVVKIALAFMEYAESLIEE